MFAEKVAELRDISAQLDQAESDLYACYDLARNLNDTDTWQSRFDQVNVSKSVADSLLSAIDTAGGWMDDAAQAVGLGAAFPALPAIGTIIGIIAAATAAIAAVYSTIEYWKERQVSLDVANGVDPETARINASGYPGKPLSANIADSFMWIALGVAAFFLIPRMVKR